MVKRKYIVLGKKPRERKLGWGNKMTKKGAEDYKKNLKNLGYKKLVVRKVTPKLALKLRNIAKRRR